MSKCRTLLLSWNSFRTLSATPCSLTNKFTLVIVFLPQLRSQPIATAVAYRVEFVSRGLSLPTTYLPPSLSTQHLFNTDIYSTSLHTQADSWLFSILDCKWNHTNTIEPFSTLLASRSMVLLPLTLKTGIGTTGLAIVGMSKANTCRHIHQPGLECNNKFKVGKDNAV
jgi:hypothetical protein